MSAFRTPLRIVVDDAGRFTLLEPFTFWLGPDKSGWAIEVPVGFETDFASVPRAFWPVFPPTGRYSKAAVVHDWLYRHPVVSRAIADAVFLHAMALLRVPRWRRWTMYLAVRLFGARNFKLKGEV